MSSANMKATAILSAEDQASQVLAMVARNFDRLNKAANMKVNGAKQHGEINAALEKRNRLLSRMAVISAATGNQLGLGFGGMAAGMAGGGLAAGVALTTAALVGANKVYADNERSMTRMAITADATRAEQDAAAISIENLADKTGMATNKVREGADVLVAAGRTMKDTMALLPAVTRTAQASGAEVRDMASSANALGNALGISSENMQDVFDKMVVGGKLGTFELKDMSRYFPEMANYARAAGLKGSEGLTVLISALQTTRMGAGTAEEAVTGLRNVFAKMYSQETQKKFKSFGVNLRKELDAVEKKGGNTLDAFINLTKILTASGKVKIEELFQDQDAVKGMRSLIDYNDTMLKTRKTINETSKGAVDRDFARVLEDQATAFDRAANASSRFAKNLGEFASPVVGGVLSEITKLLGQINFEMERSSQLKQKLDEVMGKVPAPTPSDISKESDKIIAESNYIMGAKTNPLKITGQSRNADRIIRLNESRAAILAKSNLGMMKAGEAQSIQDDWIRSDLDPNRSWSDQSEFSQAMRLGKDSIRESYTNPERPQYQRREQSALDAKIQEIARGLALMSNVPRNRAAIENHMEELKGLVEKSLNIGKQLDGKTAAKPDEIESTTKSILESAKVEVKPDQITAKVDGNVTTETVVRVEPSENFITTVTSRVISAVGNAFGSSPSTGGAVNP